MQNFGRSLPLLAASATGLVPRLLRAQDKKTTEGEEEEEKKKSTLVSDVEQFGRGPTRVALLLPDIEGPFRFAADAVLRGFQAAHQLDGEGIAVQVVRIEKDNFRRAASVYRRLERQRFSMVVGPLTRTSVSALSRMGELPIPTLALNLPGQSETIPGNCILFSMAIEFEGRSAARFAIAEANHNAGGLRIPRALVISDKSSLSRRASNAFMDAWQSFGGELEEPIFRNVSRAREVSRLLTGVRADIVFAALNPGVLKQIRPAISASLPIYGTSQLNIGALLVQENSALLASPELNGVRVVEMPWQVMPGHPAVAAYERSRRLPHLEMQRLYAFGIDSFRLTRALLDRNEQFELDGVTGRLVLDAAADPRVVREPVLAQYRDGILVPAFETEYAFPPSEETDQDPAQDRTTSR